MLEYVQAKMRPFAYTLCLRNSHARAYAHGVILPQRVNVLVIRA